MTGDLLVDTNRGMFALSSKVTSVTQAMKFLDPDIRINSVKTAEPSTTMLFSEEFHDARESKRPIKIHIGGSYGGYEEPVTIDELMLLEEVF